MVIFLNLKSRNDYIYLPGVMAYFLIMRVGMAISVKLVVPFLYHKSWNGLFLYQGIIYMYRTGNICEVNGPFSLSWESEWQIIQYKMYLLGEWLYLSGDWPCVYINREGNLKQYPSGDGPRFHYHESGDNNTSWVNVLCSLSWE